MELENIPSLLDHVKFLVEKGYMTCVNAEQLVQQCKQFSEGILFEDDDIATAKAITVIDAVDQFSFWLCDFKSSGIERFKGYNRALGLK